MIIEKKNTTMCDWLDTHKILLTTLFFYRTRAHGHKRNYHYTLLCMSQDTSKVTPLRSKRHLTIDAHHLNATCKYEFTKTIL